MHLQLILNSAAGVLTKSQKTAHITPVLKSLLWLQVSYRIDLKVFLLIFKSLISLNGAALKYITDISVQFNPCETSEVSGEWSAGGAWGRNETGADFSHYAAQHWSPLHDDLRNAPTIAIFKSQLQSVFN